MRLHPDSPAAAQAGAAAVAFGDHIAFAPGAYRPDHPAGARLLAHELAHVVQQRRGDDATSRPVPEVEGEAAAAAVTMVGGASARQLGPAPTIPLHQDAIEVELVGDVDEYHVPGTTIVYRVGDVAGNRLLMRIILGADGNVTFGWFHFGIGQAETGTPATWDFLRGAAVIGGYAARLRSVAGQFTPARWRALWPDPTSVLLSAYEAGATRVSDDEMVDVYEGMVRGEAFRQLDENERQVDALLADMAKVELLETYLIDLRDASTIRDQLMAERSAAAEAPREERFGILRLPRPRTPLDVAKDMAREQRVAAIDAALSGWLQAFPLLTRLRTDEIKSGRVVDQVRAVKRAIVATRRTMQEQPSQVDPFELEHPRAVVGEKLGAKATKVVEAEERSRRRWAFAKAGAMVIGGVALAFVPGGLYIDLVIGAAMAAADWQRAAVLGRMAQSSLDANAGLVSQATADAARWQAIVSTIFAIIPAAAVASRTARFARAFVGVGRVVPDLELAARLQIARVLAADSGGGALLKAARGDAFLTARIRGLAGLSVGTREANRAVAVLAEVAKLSRREIAAAADLYRPIRLITDGSDIQRIAKLTGLGEAEVAAARRHLMFDEHILAVDGKVVRGRFDPLDEIADQWLSAARGKPADAAFLKRLVLHEGREAQIMGSASGRALEDSFVSNQVEGMLRDLLRGKGMSAESVEHMMRLEPRPVTPYRYAHIKAHFEGFVNP